MKLKTLKNQILKEQVEIHTTFSTKAEVKEFKQQFKEELDECINVNDFIEVLDGYGYDRQTATEMLFGFLIKD